MQKRYRNKLAKLTAKSFVFDGCHKIFLCENEADEKYMKTRGWKKKDFRPFNVEEIVELYDSSCPLRAVWWGSEEDHKTPVPQGH